jgi:hypothetical protein
MIVSNWKDRSTQRKAVMTIIVSQWRIYLPIGKQPTILKPALTQGTQLSDGTKHAKQGDHNMDVALF